MNAQPPPLIFVIGSPGSGKGTLCKRLADDYGLDHVSIGDLMRRMISSSTAGPVITDHVRRGEALPASILFPVLQARINEAGGRIPVVLDGFPRRLEQVVPLEEAYGPPELVLFFDCPEKTAENRVLTRQVGRDGDTRENFRKRYHEFAELSPSILAHYGRQGTLVTVDTSEGPEVSYANLVEAVKEM